MKERLATFLVLLSLAAFAYSLPPRKDRPFYVDCLTSRECGKGQCCTIGTGRFSMPACRNYLDKGESCNHGQPVSTNLTYPDGFHVMYENIYYNFCPCASNLRCSETTATCEDPTDTDFNVID
ncbi:astakine-like isoform X1 [Cimex lectularius]|uniref:Prokineticin domain-containing protein n=1 Tax=Cimex lectularius TaxID=79782 RepID=A0A8I6S3M2_CIMLE|nr:astakine-like isoform X1 [Cimex lectularius]